MNLIICTTPFQVLVAERIIELNHPEPFVAVMIYPIDNSKYQYYKCRLFDKALSSCSVLKQRGGVKKLFFWVKLKVIGLKYKNINKVYVSSFNALDVQFFLSSVNYKELYTYDDGTANIVKSSFLHQEVKHGGIVNFVSKLLKNKYHNKSLKEISVKHYSVYKNKPNIIDNVEYISLAKNMFDGESSFSACNNDENVSLLLGQPIYELCNGLSNEEKKEKNISLAKGIMEKYNVDYYFPHPREDYILDSVNYIQSELIFEDYFFHNLTGKNCTVYTFFSGAVLLLSSLSNVKIISLKPKDYPINNCDGYALMEQFEIPVVEV